MGTSTSHPSTSTSTSTSTKYQVPHLWQLRYTMSMRQVSPGGFSYFLAAMIYKLNTKYCLVLAIALAFPDLTAFYSVNRNMKFSINSIDWISQLDNVFSPVHPRSSGILSLYSLETLLLSALSKIKLILLSFPCLVISNHLAIARAFDSSHAWLCCALQIYMCMA